MVDRIALFRGYPLAIRTDQGPEFTGKALDQWASIRGVEIKMIQAGKPTQNAYIESFNGKLRDECLNDHWFISLEHARDIIEGWRQDYNGERPHSSLGQLSPNAFAAKGRLTNGNCNKQRSFNCGRTNCQLQLKYGAGPACLQWAQE
jgi:putative transposase